MAKTVADTTTMTQPNYPPFIVPLIEQIAFVGKTFFVTNRAGDSDLPSQTLTFSLITTNGPLAALRGADIDIRLRAHFAVCPRGTTGGRA